MRTVTAEEMREIDRRSTEEFKIPGIVLMENAGRAVADAVEHILKRSRRERIAVWCGSGNNGGDGLVCARYLFNRGYTVDIILMRDPAVFKGDALLNYEMVTALGLVYIPFAPAMPHIGYGLLVDALLGTGAKGELKDDYRNAIDIINRSGKPVVSVDIPSGMDADTGKVPGTAVKASVTVTMALPKTGLLAAGADEYTGELTIAEIGIPHVLLAGRDA